MSSGREQRRDGLTIGWNFPSVWGMFPWINTIFAYPFHALWYSSYDQPISTSFIKKMNGYKNGYRKRRRREYRKEENDHRDERRIGEKEGKTKERAHHTRLLSDVCRYVLLLWCNSQRPYLLRAELDEVGDRYKKMRLVHVEAAARVSARHAKTSGDGSNGNTDGG